MNAENNKFDQINGIFSQFSEENKDRLLEIAESLLKVQIAGEASITASLIGVKALEECCSKK